MQEKSSVSFPSFSCLVEPIAKRKYRADLRALFSGVGGISQGKAKTLLEANVLAVQKNGLEGAARYLGRGFRTIGKRGAS